MYDHTLVGIAVVLAVIALILVVSGMTINRALDGSYRTAMRRGGLVLLIIAVATALIALAATVPICTC